MFSILTGRDVIADMETTMRRVWPLFSSSGLLITTGSFCSPLEQAMVVEALPREVKSLTSEAAAGEVA